MQDPVHFETVCISRISPGASEAPLQLRGMQCLEADQAARTESC